jgi:hypothetical protein
MAETIRGRSARVLGVLLLVALATRAEASGARLRWMPSADPHVIGYHVYNRAAGHLYGPSIDAGRPAAQADGSIAYVVNGVVNGLTTGQTHYFVVTAYSAAALESSFSREVALGTPNPCMIDRCISPTACEIRAAADGSSCDDGLFCNGIAVCQGGLCRNGPAPSCDDGVACTSDHCDEALARCVHVSQAGCCSSDADCIDNDACTSHESCVGGSCMSSNAVCVATSCAAAFCDPVSGCGLEPTPDGVTCDPCSVLEARKLVLVAQSEQAKLNLRAIFDADTVVDPTTSGLTFEIADTSGTVFYSSTVPPDWFVSKHDGTKFRFAASGDQVQTTNGITGVVLKRRGSAWSLNVRAASSDLLDGVAQSQLAATLRFGDVCVSDTQLACEAASSRAICH